MSDRKYKYKISVIGPSIKTKFWLNVYNNLSHQNEVSFELIFVGHKVPKFKLPENFKFIETRVKPAQCIEIAAREAKGKYLLPICDDVVFSKKLLNKLYRHTKRINDYKTFIILTHIADGKNRNDDFHIDKNRKGSPVCGLITLYSTKMWRELGGTDSRFIAVRWEYDLQMRIQEVGGKPVIVDDCIFYETSKMQKKSLTKCWSNDDKSFLKHCWRPGGPEGKGSYVTERQLPFEPYEDHNLLIESQGPKGKWA